jgi:hypothetical protein
MAPSKVTNGGDNEGDSCYTKKKKADRGVHLEPRRTATSSRRGWPSTRNPFLFSIILSLFSKEWAIHIKSGKNI